MIFYSFLLQFKQVRTQEIHRLSIWYSFTVQLIITGSNSNVLPTIFNFTSQFSSANTTAGVKNQLTSLKITTDGSTAISSATDFIIVTGTSTNGHVYGWSDSGNGVIDNGELFGLATLTGVDNDNIGASNFTFGPI